MATTKERQREAYQQYLCELGADHIETRVAKTLYDNYCLAEQETIEKACELFRKELTQFVNMLELIDKGSGSIIDVEKSITAFRKAMKGE